MKRKATIFGAKFVLALLMCAAPTMAQSIAVTGNLKDLGANNATAPTTYVQFTLQNYGTAIPAIIGTNVFVSPTPPNYLPNGSGVISGNIVPNDVISPNGTYYQVCLFNQGISQWCQNYLIASTPNPFNLNTASPIVTPPALPVISAVVTNPVGTQNIVQPLGTFLELNGSLIPGMAGSLTIADCVSILSVSPMFLQDAGACGGGGSGGIFAATNNVRFVMGYNPALSAGNGSDANNGLGFGSGMGDFYTALASLVNTNPGNGGTIWATTNGGQSGPIYPAPTGLYPQAPSTQPPVALIGPTDRNFISTTSSTRTSNVVTVATVATVPVTGSPDFSTYFETGKYISSFSCNDPTYDVNVLQIATVSGSQITYTQPGSNPNSSTAGCIIVPLGFIPQAGTSFAFKCFGASSNGITGSAGPTCLMHEDFAPKSVAISAISETGNVVTVTHASSVYFYPGLPVRIAYTPLSGSYTYDQWAIVDTSNGSTQFTVINPTSGLTSCSSNCGFTAPEVPMWWFAGAQFADIGDEGGGFYSIAALPFLEGVDSNGNPSYTSTEVNTLGVGLGFHNPVNSVFSVPQGGFGDFIFGPAVWIGSFNVWAGWWDKDGFGSNSFAPINTDERAAVLYQSSFNATAGEASNLGSFSRCGIVGGGGFRLYPGQNSGGAHITDCLQEGTGLSQPLAQLLSVGAFFLTVETSEASDSGNTQPTVVIPYGQPPQYTYVCNATLQGPGKHCDAGIVQYSYGPYTGMAPRVSGAAQGQIGPENGWAGNQDTNAGRRLFGLKGSQYTNLASQLPSGWSVIEGTGVTITPVAGPGPDADGNLAYLLACSGVGTDGWCSVSTYSGSQTYRIGDYGQFDIWEKPGDNSAGQRGVDEFGLNCCGNFAYTVFGNGATFKTNFGSAGFNWQVAAAPDDAWHHIGGWVKAALAAGAQTIDEEIRFDPAHPMIVSAPGYRKLNGNQVAIPAAPTVGQTPGGSLPATVYYFFVTYTDALGESYPSAPTVFSASANNVPVITSPIASTDAVNWNLYGGTVASGLCDTRVGGYNGPGAFCGLKVNATPIVIGTGFTVSNSGLPCVAFNCAVGYSGQDGPLSQMMPTIDTTNVIGDSMMADISINMDSMPVFYTNTGMAVQAPHGVQGAASLGGGSLTVTFSAAAVFSNNSSYTCQAWDLTTPANTITPTYSSGTQVVFAGTGTDGFNYACIGN